MSEFYNSGFLTLNKSETPHQKTVLVFGAARSGTSMLAKLLSNMGVYMGDDAKPPLFEDFGLCRIVEAKHFNAKKFIEIVKERDNTYDMWGWKKPSTLNHLKKVKKHLRNIHIIIPFRDYISISLRANISGGRNFKDHLFKLNNFVYKRIVNFINKSNLPILLISYEKAILDPKILVSELHRFLDIDTTTEGVNRLVALIERNNKDYLSANSHRGHGI